MALFSGKRKWITLFGGILLLYALIGFLGIPYYLKSYVLPDLSTTLKRPILVKDIALNPFALTLRVQGFEIQEPNHDPLVGFEELFVNFELSSVFRRSYTFDEIRLRIPFGLIRVLPNGKLNLAGLSPPPDPQASQEQPDPPQDQESPIPPIDIAQLAIEQGAVEFRDESLPTTFTVDIVPIQLSLQNFSTREKDNAHSLRADFGEGESLSWEGKVTLDPFESEGKIALTGIGLHTLWKYVQDRVQFTIPQGSGTLTARYRVEMPNEQVDVKISEGNLLIKDFVLQEKKGNQPLISIPLFEVADVDVDVLKKQVRVGTVQSQDAQFTGWLNSEGTVNFQSLFASPVETESADPPSTTAGSSPQENAPPWNVSLKTLAIQNYSAAFEDRTHDAPIPLTVSAFDVSLSDITFPPKGPITYSTGLTLNSLGTLHSKGLVHLEPLSAEAQLDISRVALQPFEPYFDQFAQFDVAGGEVNLQGNLKYRGGEQGQTLLQYAGTMGVNKLALKDPRLRKDFLAWEALAFKGVNLDIEPTAIHVDEVVLDRLVGNFIKESNGAMNIARVFSQKGKGDSSAATTSEEEPSQSETSDDPIPITIDTVRFVDGMAQYIDQSITPNVVTGLHEFTGVIKGLSSKEKTKAALSLRGKVDKFAPFQITGKINPLTKDLYTKLAISLKGMNLSPASPYSGKYAGYPIQKGKLSLDLHYSIADQHLVGENKVLIDQFTFGKKTDSPDATSLPVPFAVALLKDRRGLIDIDLPVRGDMNSPEFSYGGLILQALVNIITKVATSPFAALGNLVGGSSEELQYVEFTPGTTEISKSEVEKLNLLIKALEERPGLRLEITGAADAGRDRAALAEVKLLEELRIAQKKKNVSSGEATKAEPDLKTLGADADALRKLYVKKFGKEPFKLHQGMKADPSGENPSVSTSEGEKPVGASEDKQRTTREEKIPLTTKEVKQALLESIDIPEAELQALAKERGVNIQTQLVQGGKIKEQRVFQADVQIDPPSDTETIRAPLALSP